MMTQSLNNCTESLKLQIEKCMTQCERAISFLPTRCDKSSSELDSLMQNLREVAKFVNEAEKKNGSDSCTSAYFSHLQKTNKGDITTATNSHSKINASDLSTSMNDLPTEMWLKICHDLDIKSLTSLRLVNHRGTEVATRILNHSTLCVRFQFSKPKNKFLFKNNNILGQQNQSLQDFLICLSLSISIFPSTHFHFEGGNFAEISPLFTPQRYNVFIKTVDFQFTQGCTKMSDFLQLLQQISTTLECLGLNSIASGVVEDEADVELKLHRLRSLTLYNNDVEEKSTKILIKIILMASPHLESCSTSLDIAGLVEPEYAEMLEETKKLHCVKSIYFIPSQKNLDILDRFVRLRCKLQCLKICFSSYFTLKFEYQREHLRTQIEMMLTSIFESSGDTLKEIVMESPMGFLRGLEWPPMRNVKRIEIQVSCDFDGDHLEDVDTNGLILNADWSLIFPALETMIINFDHDASPIIFPFDETRSIESVKTLCFCRAYGDMELSHRTEYPHTWIVRLGVMLPNLTHFSISLLPNEIVTLGKLIWENLISLKSLRLRVVLPNTGEDGSENVQDFPIDVMLTGFNEMTCDRLRDGWTHPNLEGLRNPVNVFNLQELENIEVILLDEHFERLKGQLVSHVAVSHCLDCRPLSLRFQKYSAV